MNLDPEPSLQFLPNIDSNLFVGVVILLFLLSVSALISAAEVILFAIPEKDSNELASRKPLTYNILKKITKNPKKLNSSITIADYITNICIVLLFFEVFKNIEIIGVSKAITFIVKLLSISFLVLLFGDVLPKVYVDVNKTKLSPWIVFPISLIEKLVFPISFLLQKFSNIIDNKLDTKSANISVDQLSQALELTSTENTSEDEQKILEGIVSFGNTDTKQVMSPRIDLFALNIEETFAEILPKIIDKGYSRIPVYKDNIDHIKGVLFIKDLIPHINKKEFDWQSLLREPFFVPENKKLDNLLMDFQNMKNHLAIVVDEYGGTSGVVSLEDIIEEIVGDISDEFDDEDLNYSKIDDRNYIFEGKINLKDFFRIIDVDESSFEDQKGEAETLAGFILELLGNFPKRKQKIAFENLLFTIEAVDNKRIKQIKVTLNE